MSDGIQEDDFRAAARAAFEAVESKSDEAPTLEDAPEPTTDDITADAPADEVTSSSDTDVSEDAPAATEPAPTPEPKKYKAPVGWKKSKSKELFDALDPELQEDIHQREVEMNDYMQKSKPARDFAESMWKEIQPHAEELQKVGMHPAVVMRDFLDIGRKLRGGDADVAADTIAQVIAHHNINLDKLNDKLQARLQAQEARKNLPPEFKTMEQQVNQLKSQIAQRDSVYQQQVDAQVREEHARSGVEQRPHYSALKGEMGELLMSGKAKTFEQAYDMAQWRVDSVREQLVSGRTAAPSVTMDQKRAASSSLSATATKGGKAKEPKQFTDERDAARDAFRKVMQK